MATQGFEFVLQEPQNMGFSKVTQTKIRRHAMKAVTAARRENQHQGKRNLRQHMVSYVEADPNLSAAATPVGGPRTTPTPRPRNTARDDQFPDSEDDICYTSPCTTLSLSPSSSGLEAFIKDYSIGPTDLSALTSIHCPAVAASIFIKQPVKLKELLRFRQWSYFEHLYARYGRSSCLDSALHCLVLKAQTILAPSSRVSGALMLSQYGIALKALQAALNDPDQSKDIDTICATNILALFNLLHSHSAIAWKHHIAGASRLMQLRGPKAFTSEFDQAIALAMAGIIVTENFLDNEVCFLEEPEWLDVIRSCAVPGDKFSDRSVLAVDAAVLIIRMPGICKRVGDIICSEEASSEAVQPLRQELRQLRQELQRWRNRFDTQLIIETTSSVMSAEEKYKRFDSLGNALVFSLICARLLGSVSLPERFILEDEIQTITAYIQEVEESVASSSFRTSLYLEQKLAIGHRTMKTAHLWREPCQGEVVIESWKFGQWCDAIGRQSNHKQQRKLITVPSIW